MTNAKWLLFIFFIAFLLRLSLIPNPGFEADMSFWKSWGLATVDFGIVEANKITNNNYPAPFSYILGGMVGTYRLFADPHNFNEFWTNTNVLFLAIAKAFPIAADFGIAGIILWLYGYMVRWLKNNHPTIQPSNHPTIPRLGLLLASLYLFNPVSLIDGAWWGQVDSAGVFLFLLAVICVVKQKPTLAGVIYIVAVMTKLQNMIYGPLFFLLIWQLSGYRGLVRSMAGALIGFVGLNIEFLLAKEMSRVFASLTENYDYFPYASLNAYNLWWVVVGGEGMKHSDKFLTIGIINAKRLGLYIFSSVYALAMVHQFSKRKISNLQPFFESLILVVGAFFLFQTQSHDRYAFPIIVFLLLWAALSLRGAKSDEAISVDNLRDRHVPTYVGTRDDKTLIKFIGIYVFFSLLYFYNLHTALVINYPKNGLPILTGLTGPAFTVPTALVFLGLYCAFFFMILKRDRHRLYAIPLLFFLLLLLSSNLPILKKQPVSLTKLTPFVSSQDWGERVTNMPVSASGGSKAWTTLSDQYVFYKKGIGTHANSKIVYDINKLFTRLETDYGIDTEAGPQGSVVFEVWGDGKLLFRSEMIKRYDLPRHATVDITGVKNLELVTRDGGNGNVDDHTDWLNPILIP